MFTVLMRERVNIPCMHCYTRYSHNSLFFMSYSWNGKLTAGVLRTAQAGELLAVTYVWLCPCLEVLIWTATLVFSVLISVYAHKIFRVIRRYSMVFIYS